MDPIKIYFKIVFGGLTAIAVGFGIVHGAGWVWRNAAPVLANIHMPTISFQMPEINLPSFSLPSMPSFEMPSFDLPTFDIPYFSKSSVTAVAQSGVDLPASTISESSDGTIVAGFKRMIRYTADEEEGLISAAVLALPIGPDDKITADGYIVKNLTVNDSVVIEHNANMSLPIASLTKLVTAIVARKLIDPNKKIMITKEVSYIYGNTAGFKIGESFRASDLYYPLLLVSSNDAAEAFAYSYGRKNFLQNMNDFVQSIGAYRTYFADASGLSADNVSTADDLTIILSWILKNDPEIMKITQLRAMTVKLHTWVNPTHFLNWSNYLGGKNGYTPEADRTGAVLFAMGPRKNVYAIIVLGSANRDQDLIKLMGKVRD